MSNLQYLDPGSAAIQNPENLGKQGLEYAWACQRIVKSLVRWERGSSGLYIPEKVHAIGRGNEMHVFEHVFELWKQDLSKILA